MLIICMWSDTIRQRLKINYNIVIYRSQIRPVPVFAWIWILSLFHIHSLSTDTRQFMTFGLVIFIKQFPAQVRGKQNVGHVKQNFLRNTECNIFLYHKNKLDRWWRENRPHTIPVTFVRDIASHRKTL